MQRIGSMIALRLFLFLIAYTLVYADMTFTIDSLTITQVQDGAAPTENSNAYTVISRSSMDGFLVETGATDNTTAKLISTYQQQIQSTSKPPRFIFLTHGHPDHTAGIWLLQRTFPSTPIYVISQQVIAEAVRWNDFICRRIENAAPRCSVNLTSALRVIPNDAGSLSFNHPSLKLDALSVIAKAESSYAGLLAARTASGTYLLFTGDAITIRSHLFVSNYFDTDTLPNSDDALCAWAGIMESTLCNLKNSRTRPFILPGHGPVSDPQNYSSDIVRNIGWLRMLRNLTFNSCNVTYVWAEMIRQYPDFGGKELAVRGGLGTHVPADANSVNCNCNNGSPTICRVYRAPPTCIHLDRSPLSTTMSCNVQKHRNTPL